MATFNFDLPAINTGTTFVFGSWVSIADGSGGFDNHLINTINLEALQCNYPDKTVKNSNEYLLPELTDEIKKLSVQDTTSSRLPLLGLDSIYSKSSHHRRSLELRNAAVSYPISLRRKPTLRIAEQEATVGREAPIFDSYPDLDDESYPRLDDMPSLTIIATPQGCVVYW